MKNLGSDYSKNKPKRALDIGENQGILNRSFSLIYGMTKKK